MTTQQFALRIKAEGGDAVLVAKKVEDALQSAGVKGKVAFEDLGKSSDRAMGILKRQAQALLADINPMHAAQVKLNAELARYSLLNEKGLITTDQLTKAEARARLEYERMAKAAREAMENDTSPLAGARAVSRQNIQGRLNLARQGADVFTTASMGMDPAMIAIQQGPQILDAFAQAGVRITPVMGALAAAVGGVAAAVLILGGNAMRVQKDLSTFRGFLMASADASAYNAEALASMSREYDVIGATAVDARTSLKSFLAEGVNPDRLSDFGRAARDASKVLGVEFAEAAQKTGKAFTGTYDDVKALDKELNFLTFAERNHIKAMYDSNDAAGARNEAFRIFSEKYAKAYEESLTAGDRLTRNLSGAWDNLVQSLGNIGPVIKATEEVGKLVGRLGDWLQKYVEVRNLSDADLDKRASSSEGDFRAAYRARNQARARLLQVAEQGADGKWQVRQDADNKSEFRTREAAFIGSEIAYDKALKARQEARGEQDRRDIARQGDTTNNDTERNQKNRQDKAEADAKKGASRAESLRRQAEAIRVNTAETEALARAYLKSDEAAFKAEASRAALTGATRQGIAADQQAQVTSRQLQASIATAALNGAQSVKQIEDQIWATRRLDEITGKAGVTRERAATMVEKELALKPLIVARDLAEGDMKTLLTEIIGRLSDAYDQLPISRANADAKQATDATEAQIALMQKELELLHATDEARAVGMARFAVIQKHKKVLTDEEIANNSAIQKEITAAMEAAQVGVRLDQGRWAEGQRQNSEDAIKLAEYEIQLTGVSYAERGRLIERKKLEIELERRLGGLTGETAQKVLEQRDAEDEVLNRLDRVRQAREIQADLQKGFFDDLREGVRNGADDWDDLEKIAINALKRIAAEALIMATLNPFENWAIKGSNLPTLWDGKSGGGSTSGGGGFLPGASDVLAKFLPFKIPGFAKGTNGSPAGVAALAEDGPELVMSPTVANLKSGTVVKNAGDTQNWIKGLMNPNWQVPPVQRVIVQQPLTIDAKGAVMTPELLADLEQKAQESSEARLQQAMDELDRNFPDMVQRVNRDPRYRRT